LPPFLASRPTYMITFGHTFVCDVGHAVVAIDAAYWETARLSGWALENAIIFLQSCNGCSVRSAFMLGASTVDSSF